MSADRPRIWHGDEPPKNLRRASEDPDGRVIPPWLVPIVVVDSSDISPAVRILNQGDSGTTPGPRRTSMGLLGEDGSGSLHFVDPASHPLTLEEGRVIQRERARRNHAALLGGRRTTGALPGRRPR